MRGLLRVGLVAALVAGVAASGWLLRHEIGATVARLAGGDEPTPAAPAAEGMAGEEASPTVVGPEAAAHAEAKILALGRGERMEAAFNAVELTSLARHGLREFFPAYVNDVSAGLEADRLVLGGKITVREVPGIERLGASAFLLGDTAAVSARGRLDGVAPGRGIFEVETITLGPLTLPNAFRDELLTQLRAGGTADAEGAGRGSPRAGSPGAGNEGAATGSRAVGTDRPNVIGFELPAFVTDIAVRGDRLVIRRSPDSDGE
jgi:hypothetical protein